MPLTYFKATGLAHDDERMEKQLLQETGRRFVLDRDWSSPATSADGFHVLLYSSDVEFILIRTDCEVMFPRILPIHTEPPSAGIRWDNRNGEHYYIFKVDPAQKVLIAGNPTVRFFRCPDKRGKAPASMTNIGTNGRPLGPWEAEDVDQKRDVITGESCVPEHLAEAARRFKSWRAMTTNSLFVYLMVPKRLNEVEWVQLLENGIQFFDDVPWVL